MSAYSDSYEVQESDFEEFSSDELSLPPFLRPGKKISVPGAGLLSATLNTPKGPAKLNLPAAVPTQTQFRQLESALNAQTQRLNAVQAELAKVRRELVIRRREQAGFGSNMLMPLLLQKKLRDDLDGHTHSSATGPAVMPTASGSSLSSMLPLLFLMPGMLGGSSTTASSTESQDAMSPLMMMILFDAL